MEFAFPGELRDRLVRAILDGEKTATSSLLLEYEREGAPLPLAGERGTVVDSDGVPVAVIETTDVRLVAFSEIDLAFARDEGEGSESVAEWREGHTRFWEGAEFRAAIADPGFRIDPATLVVAERFRLVERL
jgi:uncharacterized protein YhfF